MRSDRTPLHVATITVGHDGAGRTAGAVVPPIFQTAQFEEGAAHEYTRLSNPTVEIFEQRVAQLEGMEHGIAYASGMAALAALARVLSSVGPIHLVTGGYAGTVRLLRAEAESGALRWAPLDLSTAVRLADIKPPASIWLETPSNPFLTEFCLSTMSAEVAKGVVLVVDNTLATPILQRPGDHGARHVVHSASKFLAGHSDVVAGIVLTRDAEVAAALRRHRCSHGGSLDPFAAWLAIRGLQTLAVRMDRGSRSAQVLADALTRHPGIERVWYPGQLARGPRPQQMQSGGAVITFRLSAELSPGRFLKSLELVTVAPSLGGVESLINQCARMSHGSLPEHERRALGIDERVFRLSVGLEDPDDVLDDLTQALKRAAHNGE